ncbi:SET domain-containing protein, partial [Wolfiporia cocos MD-104 SS10]
YNHFGRTYLFDLDFWHLHQGSEDWENLYSVDAFHAGNFTRYLNHSCDPNCKIVPCYINEANVDKPLLTIFTCQDVHPGEELCFSYFGEMVDDEEIEKVRQSGAVLTFLQDKSRNSNDAVYIPCQCGTKKCRGRMWT